MSRSRGSMSPSTPGGSVDSRRGRAPERGLDGHGPRHALFESVAFADGQVTNANLSDYQVPPSPTCPCSRTSCSSDDGADVHGLGRDGRCRRCRRLSATRSRRSGSRSTSCRSPPEAVLEAIERRDCQERIRSAPGTTACLPPASAYPRNSRMGGAHNVADWKVTIVKVRLRSTAAGRGRREARRDAPALSGATSTPLVRETCGIGVCGACTALLDGEPISTCLLLAPLAEGAHHDGRGPRRRPPRSARLREPRTRSSAAAARPA